MNAPLDPTMIVDLEDEQQQQGIGPDGVSVEGDPETGMVVDFAPQQPKEPAPAADDENLVLRLDALTLQAVGQRLVQMIDADDSSRSDWFNKFQDGLRACGALSATVTPSFAGEATCVHPLIIEAATQFQARAISEIFPAAGPVKGKVLGVTNPQVEAQAERVATYMNWQMTEEDLEYFPDTDQMLFVLPFAGSTFKKSFRDPDTGIVTSRFVVAEDVLLPGKYRGHIRSSPRVTHLYTLSHQDFLDRQATGFYAPPEKVKVDVPSGDQIDGNRTDVQADGTTSAVVDVEEDRDHRMAEVHLRRFVLTRMPGQDASLKDFMEARSYIIHVERDTQQVVSIRVNEKADKRGRSLPRCWWTHYKYLPGLGAYGYGLLHAIGGLGEAATQVLQELLHSARFAGRQGGYTSKEARLTEKMRTVEPGKWHQTDMTAEEISKAFYTPPYKEPGPALANVLGLLENAGQRFASTTEEMVGAGGENTPVGTTMARIEQGQKIYSAIHLRIHRTAGEEFKLRAELHREALAAGDVPPEIMVEGGVIQITPEDFDDRVDVAPVSDPNIVSSPQRISMATAVVQRADAKGGLYDQYEAERLYLSSMRVPDIDRILLRPAEAKPTDAVTEGQLALVGRAIKAFPEQDHASHMIVHQAQIAMLAGTEQEKLVVPAIQAHIAEHMAHQYRLEIQQALGTQLPTMEQAAQGLPPEIDAQISQGAAGAVHAQMTAMQAAPLADPNTPQSLMQRDAIANVEGKEHANRKAQREIEMMDRDVQAEMQAVVQQAVEPLVKQIEQLSVERDKAQAALDKAAKEFGDALAAAEAKREQDHERREADETRRRTEDEGRRKLEESERARKDAEAKTKEADAKAKEADGALAKITQRLDALAKAVEQIGKAEKREAQTVVVDATGKAIDATGVNKEIAAVRADLADVMKAFGDVAKAIETSGKAQADALAALAKAEKSEGKKAGKASVTPRKGGGYDITLG